MTLRSEMPKTQKCPLQYSSIFKAQKFSKVCNQISLQMEASCLVMYRLKQICYACFMLHSQLQRQRWLYFKCISYKTGKQPKQQVAIACWHNVLAGRYSNYTIFQAKTKLNIQKNKKINNISGNSTENIITSVKINDTKKRTSKYLQKTSVNMLIIKWSTHMKHSEV